MCKIAEYGCEADLCGYRHLCFCVCCCCCCCFVVDVDVDVDVVVVVVAAFVPIELLVDVI